MSKQEAIEACKKECSRTVSKCPRIANQKLNLKEKLEQVMKMSIMNASVHSTHSQPSAFMESGTIRQQ
ncbi:MAG: hypothetical protein K2W94_00125 [Alphaproteobacteria bacterium]|nr:hypothetical protein [Alphaproteobacteria bacterium]